MAGGQGSRLRPMTCTLPKPLVPVMGKPVMAYLLELLARHGVNEVGVTLQYLPEMIRRRFGDKAHGMALRYYEETAPRGTAGSVGGARDFLDETFVVMSGDALTDLNITAALSFHRQQRAKATLVLHREAVPLEYGVVLLDKDNRVQRFIEKPDWSEVFSDTVNTGMYILEPEVLRLIPQDAPSDFAKHIFPELLRRGEVMCGFVMDGYWCDIGGPQAYAQSHRDMFGGKLDHLVYGRGGGVIVDPSLKVHI